MNLILKLHPRNLAFYVNKHIHGVIPVDNWLPDSCDAFRDVLERLEVVKLDKIILEQPFLRILREDTGRKSQARYIIHTQRHFGALLYILHLIFRGVPQRHISSRVAREAVYGRHISKETQLSEVRALLDHTDHYTALQLLCLHDTMVLNAYVKKEEGGHVPKIQKNLYP